MNSQTMDMDGESLTIICKPIQEISDAKFQSICKPNCMHVFCFFPDEESESKDFYFYPSLKAKISPLVR